MDNVITATDRERKVTAVVSIKAYNDGAVTYNGRIIGRAEPCENGNWTATLYGRQRDRVARFVESERCGSLGEAMHWLADRHAGAAA